MRQVLVIVFSCMMANSALAGRDFFSKNHRGWFNFEEKQKEEIQSETNSTFATAKEELQTFQKEFDERKAQMVLHPSVPNVKHYLTYQNISLLMSLVLPGKQLF